MLLIAWVIASLVGLAISAMGNTPYFPHVPSVWIQEPALSCRAVDPVIPSTYLLHGPVPLQWPAHAKNFCSPPSTMRAYLSPIANVIRRGCWDRNQCWLRISSGKTLVSRNSLTLLQTSNPIFSGCDNILVFLFYDYHKQSLEDHECLWKFSLSASIGKMQTRPG